MNKTQFLVEIIIQIFANRYATRKICAAIVRKIRATEGVRLNYLAAVGD